MEAIVVFGTVLFMVSSVGGFIAFEYHAEGWRQSFNTAVWPGLVIAIGGLVAWVSYVVRNWFVRRMNFPE
jgi:hypothetical protein